MSGDPRNIPAEQLEKMRSEIARQHGFLLWSKYSEKQAASFNGIDYTTQKRRRKSEPVPHVLYESGKVQYIGAMIADHLLFGAKAALLWGGASPDEGQQAAE